MNSLPPRPIVYPQSVDRLITAMGEELGEDVDDKDALLDFRLTNMTGESTRATVSDMSCHIFSLDFPIATSRIAT